MKRVFIVHGWGGYPEEAWFPWMKTELEKRGFSVTVPMMPDAAEPKMHTWIPFLSQQVGHVDDQTYFIGHSIGCQTIIRYLETLPAGAKIGGAVFVAGFYDLRNLETQKEEEIAGPWLKTPRNDEKIRKILDGHAVAIFSDNDPWVDINNKKHWEDKAGAKTVLLHEKGHFNDVSGVTELPEALAALLEVSAPRYISIDDFAKVYIKIGKILNAEKIPNADKLLKLTIDVGEGCPCHPGIVRRDAADFSSQPAARSSEMDNNPSRASNNGVHENQRVPSGFDQNGQHQRRSSSQDTYPVSSSLLDSDHFSEKRDERCPDGRDMRTICSGIAQYYQPEELIGKQVPVLTNLAPRMMRGIESNGMVLFGIDETNGAHIPVMINPHKEIPPGSPVQ